jgi:hypothetical protein
VHASSAGMMIIFARRLPAVIQVPDRPRRQRLLGRPAELALLRVADDAEEVVKIIKDAHTDLSVR